MRKALIVARWEFMTTVRRRSYIFTVAAVPLFFALMMTIPFITGRASVSSASNRAPVAIVDPGGLISVEFAVEAAARREAARGGTTDPVIAPALTHYVELETALADLSAGEVSAVYAIDADYVSTG